MTDYNINVDLIKESYNKPFERKKEIDGYSLIDSQEDKAVYKKGDKLKLVYRGSATPQDWFSNFNYIALGRERLDPQYIKDDIHFRNLKVQYPNSKIETLGHSRGGNRADMLSRIHNVPSTGFNPAPTFFKRKNELNQTYRTLLDPVSMFNDKSNTKTILGNTGDFIKSHSPSQFDSPLFI